MYLIALARTIQEDKERQIQEAGRRFRLLSLLREPTAQPGSAATSTATPAASEADIAATRQSRPAPQRTHPARPAQPCGPAASTGPAAR